METKKPTKLELLLYVKAETERFLLKLNQSIDETKNGDGDYRSFKFASAKRSALDLRNELTKVTQCSKYIWGER